MKRLALFDSKIHKRARCRACKTVVTSNVHIFNGTPLQTSFRLNLEIFVLIIL